MSALPNAVARFNPPLTATRTSSNSLEPTDFLRTHPSLATQLFLSSCFLYFGFDSSESDIL